MTPVAVAAMFLGATIICGLAIFGGFKLFELIEYRRAIRARLKSLGPFDPSNDVSGDVAHVPEGVLFVSHNRKDAR